MSDEETAEAPKIKVTDTGPYMVSGQASLIRRSAVMSEQDEPVTWKTGESIDTKARYALCRCGQSSNKPFCDGTHNKVEWDSDDHAPDGTYADRRVSLGGEGIEVFDDRTTCAHIGFCGNKVTNIWNLAEQTGDSRIRAEAIAMVERCPSGALSYVIDDEQIEPHLPTEIALITDGPIWVTGGIEVERAGGDTLDTRNRVTLCRCGQSKSKPLCDGSHWDAGFKG